MVVPIFNSAPTFLCFSMWVQRSFQCIIQISTIQEKVKNAGVFNVQFTKENLRSYLPLTPMPKGHSDSIDDNLPAYLLYLFIQRHAGTSRYSISVQMHGFTCPHSFFLSFFLMFSTAAPSLCFQYFFDDSYFKLVGGTKEVISHSYGEELF